MNEENKIIIIYIGVQGIRSEDIEIFIKKLTEKITPSTMKGEFIVIPTQSLNTRIECINPKYITEENLIQEHTKMMKNLQEQLQHQLKQLKEENNG